MSPKNKRGSAKNHLFDTSDKRVMRELADAVDSIVSYREKLSAEFVFTDIFRCTDSEITSFGQFYNIALSSTTTGSRRLDVLNALHLSDIIRISCRRDFGKDADISAVLSERLQIKFRAADVIFGLMKPENKRLKFRFSNAENSKIIQNSFVDSSLADTYTGIKYALEKLNSRETPIVHIKNGLKAVRSALIEEKRRQNKGAVTAFDDREVNADTTYESDENSRDRNEIIESLKIILQTLQVIRRNARKSKDSLDCRPARYQTVVHATTALSDSISEVLRLVSSPEIHFDDMNRLYSEALDDFYSFSKRRSKMFEIFLRGDTRTMTQLSSYLIN